MASCFLKKGNCFHVTSSEALNLHPLLPPQNYVAKVDPQMGFYLEMIDAFTLPKKIYGNCTKDAQRILNTFQDRGRTTGVLLSGEKGSGKTLLAKAVSIDAAKLGMPTIAITNDFTGEAFDTFLQTIQQPSIILFDEFEKVYDNDKQSEILTLLDGVFSSNKMFIFTCNDRWKINIHMRNRPGRIFYAMNFKGLDADFIAEYCRDTLHNLAQIDSICALAMLFDEFNFDMLQSLVEEMNRYEETAEQVVRMLNVKPEMQERAIYDIRLTVSGQAIVSKDLYDGDDNGEGTWRGQPLNSAFNILYKVGVDEDGDPKWENVQFQPNHLKKLDASLGEYAFVNEKGDQVVMRRKRPEVFEYSRIL